MSTPSAKGSVKLELTEVESQLRQLLLDVAAYIESTPTHKGMTSVEVPEKLAKEEIVLRWTGGWVRDKLLKVPSHDIDLAINNMTGEHFGLRMQEYLEIPGNAEKYRYPEKSRSASENEETKKAVPKIKKIEANPEKSKNLETALTKIMGIDLDMVNLRKETYSEMSRNPQMEFGTAEEDAVRRDATVNAMFYNLHSCQVEDFTQKGFEDMAAKILRTPLEPWQTFKDDPLRVLRLIRFASRLDYIIEAETGQAMGNADIQDALKVKISRERVGIEVEKMLRGPRPLMALELINRFGLYETVFTDPTRLLPVKADLAYFRQAYEFVHAAVGKDTKIPRVILETLIRNEDEQYMAWIAATVMPWADAPTIANEKPSRRPYYAAYLVAREGLKAPNRICDMVTSSLGHGEEIRTMVAGCALGLRRPDRINPANDLTARDTLGMAIRRWGSTWRMQVLFNLIYEAVLGQTSQQDMVQSYADFLAHVSKLEILDADTFKPLLKGAELAQALGTTPGPWMKDALNVVMAWQLRNPGAMDAAQAIRAVKASRNHPNDSELPSCLACHFLQLTIAPFFWQNRRPSDALAGSRQATRWTDAANYYVVELLRWCIGGLNETEMEKQWRFLVPPILGMMDKMEVKWKAKGCHLLGLLLERVWAWTVSKPSSQSSMTRRSSTTFLQRTGHDNVFADSLFPLFTYIPSLTAEEDSVLLFEALFPAVTWLALLLPQTDQVSSQREEMLDRIVRTGVVSILTHFDTPCTYPDLCATMLEKLSVVVGHAGIGSVKHLQKLVPLVSSVLADPFVLGHEGLAVASLKALQSLMLNAWPRLPGYRAEVLMGLCVLWRRCMDGDETADSVTRGRVQRETVECVAILDAVMVAVEDEGLVAEWEVEKQALARALSGFGDLFGSLGKG